MGMPGTPTLTPAVLARKGLLPGEEGEECETASWPGNTTPYENLPAPFVIKNSNLDLGTKISRFQIMGLEAAPLLRREM